MFKVCVSTKMNYGAAVFNKQRLFFSVIAVASNMHRGIFVPTKTNQ